MKKITLVFMLLFLGSFIYGQNSSSFLSTNTSGDVIIGAPAGTASADTPEGGDIVITHSATQNIVPGDGITCNAGGIANDNLYFRDFDLENDFGIDGIFNVTSAEVGIETLITSTGTFTLTANIYTTDAPFPTGTLTLLGTGTLDAVDADAGTVVSIPVDAVVPAGAIMVYELSITGDGVTQFFVGANQDGQTGVSWIQATDCGADVPTDLNDFGFPNSYVMNVVGELGSVEPFTECGPVPVDIIDNDTVTSAAPVAESGIIGTDFEIDNVDIDITHTFDGDLVINLVSPEGTSLLLSDGNGGAGDNYTDTVFQDGGDDITAAGAPFTGTFEPQGGTFAATFDGEEIVGDWTLSIEDTAGGDQGTLDFYCITFAPLEAPLEIECQDITVSLDENGDASIEAGDIVSGSFDSLTVDVSDFTCDDIGENTVVVTAMLDGETATCEATVTIVDDLPPVLECPADVMFPTGDPSVPLPDFTADGSAVDNCTVDLVITQDPAPGTAVAVGTSVTVTLSTTDESTNEGSCTFIYTVTNEDNFTECGPTGQVIDGATNDPVNSVATVTETGIIGDDVFIDNVAIDITHTFDGDLEISLISPAGTTLGLSLENGGGNANYTDTVFQDGGDDITAADAPFTGIFQPQGGTFADTFAGEDIAGDWTLNIVDIFASGEAGTLNMYCITFSPVLSVADNAFDGFNFFPNPAQNTLNISAQTEVQNITIINLVGQVVLEQEVGATTSQLDISRLRSGVYLMQVAANGQIGTYKVIKE